MKKTVLIVIRVICIVGFLVCAGVLGWYWHNDRSDRAVAEALAAAHDAASAAAMEQVRAVAADNADTIGWLRIDGTNINNVVMFAPDTPGKYLHMDFYGKWSYRGTLYVAENCDVRTADNILIYGHHMKDGSMFGSLISYKDAAFRAAHPIVQFDTLYASHSYEIVAAIETEIPAEGSDAFDITTAPAPTRSSLRSTSRLLKKPVLRYRHHHPSRRPAAHTVHLCLPHGKRPLSGRGAAGRLNGKPYTKNPPSDGWRGF